MGAWSEPVEGSTNASQEPKAGKMCGLVNARSIALGL